MAAGWVGEVEWWWWRLCPDDSTLAFNAQTSDIDLPYLGIMTHCQISGSRVQKLAGPCHMRMMRMRGIRMGNATRGPCWSAQPVRSRQERVAQGALGGLASCQGADQIRIQGSARIYGAAARRNLRVSNIILATPSPSIHCLSTVSPSLLCASAMLCKAVVTSLPI